MPGTDGYKIAATIRSEEAAAHYLAALQLAPDSAVAHNNLARLRHSQGRLDDATPPLVLSNRNEGLQLICRLLLVNDKALNTT